MFSHLIPLGSMRHSHKAQLTFLVSFIFSHAAMLLSDMPRPWSGLLSLETADNDLTLRMGQHYPAKMDGLSV